jgi:hypothetical protein
MYFLQKKITKSSTSYENLLELLLDIDLQNTYVNTAPIVPPSLPHTLLLNSYFMDLHLLFSLS